MSLEEAISLRRSVRSFSRRPVSMEMLSQLLWSAQGKTGKRSHQRAAPSAGGTHPMEIYLAREVGLFSYHWNDHSLTCLKEEDMRPILFTHGLEQESLRSADTIFVLAAEFQRCSNKYGARAERYVKMEAGHVGQNILLQAVALGLGGLPIGAFHDAPLHAALGLPHHHELLYLIPVGWPDV